MDYPSCSDKHGTADAWQPKQARWVFPIIAASLHVVKVYNCHFFLIAIPNFVERIDTICDMHF